MSDITGVIAHWLGMVLPDWLELPNISFELPHAIYWLGLILFPLAAIFLVHRARERGGGPRVSMAVAFMLWLFGGFAGLHRFYLRSGKAALVFVGLFLVLLYANTQGNDARNVLSVASDEVRSQEFRVEHFAEQAERGREGAAERAAEARERLEEARATLEVASTAHQDWRNVSGLFGLLIAVFLFYDLIRLRALYRRCAETEPPPPPEEEIQIIERGPAYDPRSEIQNPVSRLIDRISGWTGQYVAYWSIIAVFVYYFEVVSRYVFNAPTNWAHESMFLMFGMQYVLSGAYAYREDAHVRVDVIYEKLPIRLRAVLDIITSTFFFIFAATLLVTGIIFASQSIGDNEVSFNEWAIHYWPAKLMIPVGAFLILLQGIAHLLRDIQFLASHGRRTRG